MASKGAHNTLIIFTVSYLLITAFYTCGAKKVKSKDSEEDDGENMTSEACRHIRREAMAFLYDAVIPRLEQNPQQLAEVKRWVRRHIHVNLLDDREVMGRICDFADVTSISELSELLDEDWATVFDAYQSFTQNLLSFGTVVERQRRWQIVKDVTFGIRTHGFPWWPLDINFKETKRILKGWEEEYGPRYLYDMLEYVYPDVDMSREEDVDYERLARAVAGTVDFDQFVAVSRLSPETVQLLDEALMRNMSPDWPERVHYWDSAYDFYLKAEEIGLLSLP